MQSGCVSRCRRSAESPIKKPHTEGEFLQRRRDNIQQSCRFLQKIRLVVHREQSWSRRVFQRCGESGGRAMSQPMRRELRTVQRSVHSARCFRIDNTLDRCDRGSHNHRSLIRIRAHIFTNKTRLLSVEPSNTCVLMDSAAQRMNDMFPFVKTRVHLPSRHPRLKCSTSCLLPLPLPRRPSLFFLFLVKYLYYSIGTVN